MLCTREKKEGNSGMINTASLSWTCQVCGKSNCERSQKKCACCGRNQNYQGSKKIQQLNKLRIDPTPLSTAASKQRLKEVQNSNKRLHRWEGEDAKRNMFIATKADFEELQRCEIKTEINVVLDSIRKTMGTT